MAFSQPAKVAADFGFVSSSESSVAGGDSRVPEKEPESKPRILPSRPKLVRPKKPTKVPVQRPKKKSAAPKKPKPIKKEPRKLPWLE